MTNKIQKIREGIEKLKSNLIHGACSSQVAMENHCKEEAYNEVLAILDSMQEEPVSGLDNGDMPIERWKQAVEAASNQRNYRSSKGLTETRDDYFVDGVQWADEHPKKEHVSEEWIEELRTKLDSMSKEDFKKVFDKYAIDFNEEPVSDELIDVAKQYVKEHVIGIDKVTFSIATDMFISGAKWQREQMMMDAIDVTVHIDAGGYPYIPQMELYDYDKDVPLAKEGDKYKVVLIKEE